MAVPQKRYADVREAYFSTRPPPIPPKQEKRRSVQGACMGLGRWREEGGGREEKGRLVSRSIKFTRHIKEYVTFLIYMYMIKSCTCICKGRQDKVRHSQKADSEKNH